jgi:hypothetical protein
MPVNWEIEKSYARVLHTCHMCPLIFDFLFNGLVALDPNRLINLHYWEIVSIYFHSKNWIQSMTRKQVKTVHLPNSRDSSGDWKISGERTHFGKFMTRVTRKKNRVSWHVWTTFSYIGYMYIGTTPMVCRNALKDINETWYASCIYRLSD